MKQFDDSLLDAALDRYHFDRETGHFFVVVRDIDGRPHITGKFAGTITPTGIRLTTSKRHVMAHHLAWRIYKGEWPLTNIKHRDSDVTNCKEENLYCPGAEAAQKAERKQRNAEMLKFYLSIGITQKQLKRMQVDRVREKLGELDALGLELEFGFITKKQYKQAVQDLGKTPSK